MTNFDFSLSFTMEDNQYTFIYSIYNRFFDGTLIQSYEYGSLAVELANTDINNIVECINFPTSEIDFPNDDYILKCYNNLSAHYSKVLSILIISEFATTFDERNNESDNMQLIKEWFESLFNLQKISIKICDHSFKNINEKLLNLQNIKSHFVIDEKSNHLKAKEFRVNLFW